MIAIIDDVIVHSWRAQGDMIVGGRGELDWQEHGYLW